MFWKYLICIVVIYFIWTIKIFSQPNSVNNLNQTIVYPESDGFKLKKTLLSNKICNNTGNFEELNKLAFDGSILFEFGSWNASGLPSVFGVWKVAYFNKKGETLQISDNNISNAFPFSNGFAMVQKGSKYNFINRKGQLLCKIWFDYAENFSNSLALVSIGQWNKNTINGKFGFIDTLGRPFIPLMFDAAESFSHDKARVWIRGRQTIINNKGMPISSTPQNRLEAGLTMLSGNAIRYQRPDDEDASLNPLVSWSDTLLKPFVNNNMWGFSNKKGETVIPARYDYAQKFSEGVATVKKDNKWTFIQSNGTQIISEWFDDVQNFRQGIAIVKKDGKSAIIDRFGKIVVPFIYPVRFFGYGIACIETPTSQGKNFTFINGSGNTILPWLYSAQEFKNGLSEIESTEGLLATIDSTGKIVNDWHYRVLYQGSEVEILECKGLFKYRDRKKGQVSVNWMHDYEMFPESIVAMKRDSGWGYVNKQGKTILEFKYDECWNFKDGIALVRQAYAFNFIDKNGKTKSDWYNTIGEFSNNLAPVAKKNKWGYINQNGQLVIKLQYNFASKFSEGYAAVKKGRKFGYINTTGKKVIPMEFTAAGNFENGKAIVKKGKFHGYIDTAGNFYNQ